MNAKKIFRSCREQKRHEILWAGSLAKILFTWPEPDISCSIRSVWFPPCWQWGCSGALPKNQKQLKFCVFPASYRSARSIGRQRESARLVQSCHEKVKHSRLKIFKGRAENRRKRCAGRSVLSFLAFEPGVQVSVTIPIRIGEQNRVIFRSTCGAPRVKIGARTDHHPDANANHTRQRRHKSRRRVPQQSASVSDVGNRRVSRPEREEADLFPTGV